jgi:DNA-binding NtrC family response regulator
VAKNALRDDFERGHVERLMQEYSDNITQAARAAEIDRVYFLRLLDKLDMRPTRRK